MLADHLEEPPVCHKQSTIQQHSKMSASTYNTNSCEEEDLALTELLLMQLTDIFSVHIRSPVIWLQDGIECYDGS